MKNNMTRVNEVRAALINAGVKDVGRVTFINRERDNKEDSYTELRIESESLYSRGEDQTFSFNVLKKVQPSLRGVASKAIIKSRKAVTKNKTRRNGIIAHIKND